MPENIQTTRISNGKLMLRSVVVCFSIIPVLAGLAVFLSRYEFFVAELLNNFRLQIGATIVICAVAMAATGLRKLGLAQTILGICVLFPLFSNVLTRQEKLPGDQVISLLSYNVLGDNEDKQPVVNLLANAEADITVVIEYTWGWQEALQPLRDSNLYSLEAPRWHGFGIALFSKYPLENEQVVMLSPNTSDFPFLISEIVVGDQRIIVAAGHFLAPMSPLRMNIRNQKMADAARVIEDYRNNRNLPVVLVGDFNAVPWSPCVKDLMQTNSLRDSRAGYWYQASWPNDNMLLRIPIDHALISDHVHVHRRRLLDCYSSDHLPLLLEFSLPALSESAD